MERGLYLHIPFCLRKCQYCDFTSFSDCRELWEGYANALCTEMRRWAGLSFSTVFIGGGTPSVIPPKLMELILSTVHDNFSIDPDAEITIEVNPGTIDRDKLETYRYGRVNRISMGLQSADDDALRLLGRIHTYQDFLYSYDLVRQAGFDNCSIDLISGLPGQTKDSLLTTIDRVTSLSPAHISLYSLIVEPGTPFYEQFQTGTLDLPDEETLVHMERSALMYLAKMGYERYEISNFAKKGYQCRHNLNYWNNGEYLGIGCAAASKLRGMRWTNTRSLESYLSAIRGSTSYFDDFNFQTVENDMFETIMLALRLTRGLSIEQFDRCFHISFQKTYEKELRFLTNLGMLIQSDGYVHLTEKGMEVQNGVLEYFLSDARILS